MESLNESVKIANDKGIVQALIESSKYDRLSLVGKQDMTILLENAQDALQSSINEGTLTTDISKFTPIMLPLVRRIYPNLIANELLGVQPMTMPSGYIYALVNQYLGNGQNKVSDGEEPTGVIYEFDANVETAVENGIVASGTSFAVGQTIGSGKILYVEGNKILASFNSTKLAVGTKIGADSTATPTAIPGVSVTGVYTNEASFGKILKNFTGPYTTYQGENLSDDMREVGFSVSRKLVEVQTRKLKGRYTVEMYQDLLAQHNLTADEEIMNLMQYEIQAELDRQIVDFVNGNAQILPDTNFGIPTQSSDIIIPDGRWEIERYRAQVVRIAKESALIGIDTKRGQGNVLVVSPLVATMLEQVGTISSAPVQSDVVSPISGGYAGVFDNRYKVIIDQYATSDYCTVLYKGTDSRDAMGFFAPYVPLQFTRTASYESGQPAIIATTRYGLTTIPGIESADSNDRAKLYARNFGVDFTNTVLSHN